MKSEPTPVRREEVRQRPLLVAAAYSALDAAILTAANEFPIFYVVDSWANIFGGFSTTRDATIEQLVENTRFIKNGINTTLSANPDLTKPHLYGDMPFESLKDYESCLRGAQRFRDADCVGLKIEYNGEEHLLRAIKNLVEGGFYIHGHIGFTPQQTTHVDKGIVQGKTQEGTESLFKRADELALAGVHAIFLEAIPWQIAEALSFYVRQKYDVSTIGFGSGPYTHGQGLIFYEAIGLTEQQWKNLGRKKPLFAPDIRHYGNDYVHQVKEWAHSVREGTYPDINTQSYSLSPVDVNSLRDFVHERFNVSFRDS